MKLVSKALISALFSAVVYFGIALMLIFFIEPERPAQAAQMKFNELFIDYDHLPKLNNFTARDGSLLSYRYYPSSSDIVVILLHGSGWHSQYFLPLAHYLSSEGIARVFTPDLRGHGLTPGRRGDVDYIGQFDDDLADLIGLIKKDNPNATMIVGGHSSGGGLALRFGGSAHGSQADAYILLSPFLKYNAASTRPNSGGWACPYTGRIAGLSMLNNLGIHLLDYLPAIEFAMPTEARNGTETLIYSHRLNTSYAPRNYKKDLSAIKQPLLVVAGTADEAFVADQFEPIVTKWSKGEVILLPSVTHMGLIVGPEIEPVVKKWIEELETATE